MSPTTWDPNTNSGQILSNGNTTATDPGNNGVVHVEGTNSLGPGQKVMIEFVVSGGDVVPGMAGGAGTALGVGFATQPFDGIVDPNDPSGPNDPLGNHLTNPYPSYATSAVAGYDGSFSLSGSFVLEPHRGISQWADHSYVDIAIDTVNNRIWAYSSSVGQWNNDPNANPATNTGGIDISSMAGETLFPIVDGWTTPGGTATINGGVGGFRGALPAGFAALDKPPTTPTPATVTIGSGPDTLALQMSEDAWNGDAQFTVAVDGTQIGGTQTTTALHSAGQTQTFNVLGSFAAGVHTVVVNFRNDAYGGSPSADRNLFVTGATIDGSTVSGATLKEYVHGPRSFTFLAPGSSGSGPDTIVVTQPVPLKAGVQTIVGTESDPTQPVFLDWHSYGVPALSATDWVQATVSPNGSFSASINIDNPGSASTMFYHTGSGQPVAAWSATPS